MENEKKTYEPIEITKVEFDAGDRITASSCNEVNELNQSWCLIT